MIFSKSLAPAAIKKSILLLFKSSKMLSLSSRSTTCAKNEEGVAPVTKSVVIIPFKKPFLARISVRFDKSFPSLSVPIARLFVFVPVAIAVPPAAESVTRSSKLEVFTKPIFFNCVSVNSPRFANTAEEI